MMPVHAAQVCEWQKVEAKSREKVDAVLQLVEKDEVLFLAGFQRSCMTAGNMRNLDVRKLFE